MLALVRSNMFFFVFNRQTENWRRAAGVLSIPTVEAEKVFLPRPPHQLPKKKHSTDSVPVPGTPASGCFDVRLRSGGSLQPAAFISELEGASCWPSWYNIGRTVIIFLFFLPWHRSGWGTPHFLLKALVTYLPFYLFINKIRLRPDFNSHWGLFFFPQRCSRGWCDLASVKSYVSHTHRH